MTTTTAWGPVPRRVAAAVVAVLAIVSLAACSPDRLGAAAIVDGDVIATDDLQAATRSYEAIVPGGDTAGVQVAILQRLVLSRIIDKVAAGAGVHVGSGAVARQRDKILQSTKGRKGLVKALAQQQNPVVLAPQYIDRWVRDQLLYTKVITKLAGAEGSSSPTAATRGNKALVKAAKSMDITINPRYGSWNPSKGIEAQLSGGLSRTAAQLSKRQLSKQH